MSTRRVAVVDMGSNTGRLVIYRLIGDDAWYLEDEIREVVRLREGMAEAEMARPAMQRGIAVLRLFRRFCDSVQADTVIATATSAVRDATNGSEFLERAREVSGWDLHVLAPADEARLGAMGLLGEVPMAAGVVVDIGGGSAQISRVEAHRWVEGVSLPLGSLRLTERFFKGDPPAGQEVESLRSEVRSQLGQIPWLGKLPEGAEMGGLGGTVRNLGYIEHARLKWPLPTLRGFQVERERVDALVTQFVAAPRARRARIPGLNPDRADILTAGAIVLQELMHMVDAAKCHTSVNGLREGLLLEHFFPDGPPVGTALREFSVNSLGCRYGISREHALRVQHLSTRLFDDLAPAHELAGEWRELLQAAAILHDVGTVLGYHDHHRHSETLVGLNGLPGYSARETALIALMTRYHRKGTPTPGIYRRVLAPGDQLGLKWASAMLRMAEYLERGRNGNVTDVEVADWGRRGLEIIAHAHGDATVEMWDTERTAMPLLESLLDRRVRLSTG